MQSKKRYKIQQFAQRINFLFIGIFIFCMPLYRWFLPYFIGFLAISWGVAGNFSYKFRHYFLHKKNYSQLLLPLFFCITAVSFFYSEDKISAGKDIEQKLSFLLLPLFLIGISHFFTKFRVALFKLFIAGNFLAGIISLTRGIYRSFHFKGGEFIFDASVQQNGMGFIESIIQGGNFLFYSELSTFMHPAYWAMYLCLSMVFLFVIRQSVSEISVRDNVLFYALIVFFSGLIFMLSSRAGILSFLLILGGKVGYHFFKTKRIGIKIALPSLIILLLLIVASNARFKLATKEFLLLVSSEKSITENKNLSERFMMWNAGILTVKDNFWLGAGIGDAKKQMNEKYKTFRYAKANHIKLNAHNQYIETFSTIGVSGFILLLLLIFLPLREGIKRKDAALIGFSALILLNFIFESMLNTISGVLFFTFFYVFLQENRQLSPS